MESTTVVQIALLAVILIALVWIGYRLRPVKKVEQPDSFQNAFDLLRADLVNRQSETLLALRQSLDTANRTINERLADGTASLDRRMNVLADLQKQLGELTEQTRKLEAVGKEVQDLSGLLRPPKLRGSVGEMLLTNLLDQILPGANYTLQYRFAEGRVVDAVVELGDRLLPVDAKFPLEAYQRLAENSEDAELQKQFTRGFKKHVDDIATKYIRPGEGTTDYALMYIPAETVYYQLISQTDQEGFDYALSKRVIPSSPGHLYAFLASVVALQAELALAGRDASDFSRRFVASMADLAETTEALGRLHSRMEGSVRMLTSSLGKAGQELDKVRLQLARLKEPEGSGQNADIQTEVELDPN